MVKFSPIFFVTTFILCAIPLAVAIVGVAKKIPLLFLPIIVAAARAASVLPPPQGYSIIMNCGLSFVTSITAFCISFWSNLKASAHLTLPKRSCIGSQCNSLSLINIFARARVFIPRCPATISCHSVPEAIQSEITRIERIE